MAKVYCTHDRCLIDSLHELTYLMRLRGTPMTDSEIRAKYIEMASKSVPCHIKPRPGLPEAPLP